MGWKSGDALRGRRCRAWLAVAAAAATIAGICLFSGNAPMQGEGHVRGADAAWEALRDGATERQAAEACGVATSAEPPDWFAEEVPLGDATVAYADEGWTLVRADAACPPDRLGQRLREDLERAGWTHVESGCEGVSTFAKTEGRCTWLMVESAEAEGGTSAVLHILHG